MADANLNLTEFKMAALDLYLHFVHCLSNFKNGDLGLQTIISLYSFGSRSWSFGATRLL